MTYVVPGIFYNLVLLVDKTALNFIGKFEVRRLGQILARNPYHPRHEQNIHNVRTYPAYDAYDFVPIASAPMVWRWSALWVLFCEEAENKQRTRRQKKLLTSAGVEFP